MSLLFALLDSSQSFRSDYRSTLYSAEAYDGNWYNPVYCNDESYIYSYRLNIESPGDCSTDCLGAIAIEARCASIDGSYVENIIQSPYEGPSYGDWSSWTTSCYFMDGFQSKISNSFDDEGLICLYLRCSTSQSSGYIYTPS